MKELDLSVAGSRRYGVDLRTFVPVPRVVYRLLESRSRIGWSSAVLAGLFFAGMVMVTDHQLFLSQLFE